VFMNYELIRWNTGSTDPGWIQMSAVFPAYGGDIMTIDNKEINRDEKVDVKLESSDRDLSCCCITDPCGCVVDPCGCNIDPCGCSVETCCC